MIQTMATFGYYATWILIALAVIFIVAPLMAAPLVGLAVCTGGWALPGFPLIAMIAISYFLTAIWCGYWVYYRPARMDNEATYPETWKR